MLSLAKKPNKNIMKGAICTDTNSELYRDGAEIMDEETERYFEQAVSDLAAGRMSEQQMLEHILGNFEMDEGKIDDAPLVARQLLEAFGSFGGVFNATVEELEDVCGEEITEGIKAILICCSVYMRSRRSDIQYMDINRLSEYLQGYFLGSNSEEILFAGLNEFNFLTDFIPLGPGGAVDVTVASPEIVNAVEKKFIRRALLVHNHPNSSCYPSESDMKNTLLLIEFFGDINVNLWEHIVIGNNGVFFMMAGRYVPREGHNLTNRDLKRINRIISRCND